jgi:TolB protein
VEDVSPLRWDWGEAAGRVAIRTWAAGDRRPLPVRLAVTDRDGHPLLPDDGQPRFDSQGGRTYVYSPGWLELTVPAGEVRVTATHGFAFPALGGAATVAPGGAAVVEIEYPALAEPRRDGWYSGDHHWHLNYGGPYPLRPEDVLTLLEAEDLDVATPQVANHHTRLLDQEYWSWRRLERPPLVAFAQEVRSHFLGHLGLMGLSSPYWPWYWGPGYPALAQEDLANAEALAHARRQGGFGWYVHPVTPRDPFPAGAEPSGIPLELVPDAVLGDLDGVEVACLWSDEMGTSALWHRLLNLGLAVVPTAGTDAFPNFFRTMAVGATRVYVKPDGPLTMESYLAALKAGRSYVTNGPLLTFTVDGRGPGDVIEARAGGEVAFSLEVASAVTVESVEVLVNGRAAFTSRGPRGPGVLSSRGRLRVPPGGWISARAHGGATAWPAMDSYPFAHTAPVWVGRKGSRDPAAAAEAARDLLRWMDVAERRLAEAYAEGQDLKARFAQARRVLARAAAGRP